MKKQLSRMQSFLFTIVFLIVLFSAHTSNEKNQTVLAHSPSFPSSANNGAYLAPTAEPMPIFVEADIAECNFVPNLPQEI
jgi:hypothetical protein